jgi:hypothetical protein
MELAELEHWRRAARALDSEGADGGGNAES